MSAEQDILILWFYCSFKWQKSVSNFIVIWWNEAVFFVLLWSSIGLVLSIISWVVLNIIVFGTVIVVKLLLEHNDIHSNRFLFLVCTFLSAMILCFGNQSSPPTSHLLAASNVIAALMNSVDVVQEYNMALYFGDVERMVAVDKSTALHPEYRRLGLIRSINNRNAVMIEYYMSSLHGIDINSTGFVSRSLRHCKVFHNFAWNWFDCICGSGVHGAAVDSSHRKRKFKYLQTAGGAWSDSRNSSEKQLWF